jgi:L-ascorbate metabolism protein UlaG (beta-lactamase superfamily)
MADRSVTFVGTATTVLRLGAFTLLTDPNFLHRGQRAYLGYGLSSRRRTEPALSPDELPALDALVLSHLHGDHFDRVARARLARDLPVVTTGQAARKLRRWGFGDCLPLAPWSSTDFVTGAQRLRVTAVPGRHGPGPVDRLLPDVIGTVLEHRTGGGAPFRLYITGDVLFRPELARVTERFGPPDAMLAHLGGTRILGVLVTMDARQGADLVELLRPALTIPVHYDDYPVFRSPLRDFLTELRGRRLPGQVRPVRRGDTVSLEAERQPATS